MSDTAREWLAQRSDDVPPSLQLRMEQASAAADADSLVAELTAAALECLRVALQKCDDRAAALDLLAADALVTYACAAAAEEGDAALAALCDTLSTERLQALMPAAT